MSFSSKTNVKGKHPETNLYQRDFQGTSNVYTPYIYKTVDKVETFKPSNLYDDNYSKY